MPFTLLFTFTFDLTACKILSISKDNEHAFQVPILKAFSMLLAEGFFVYVLHIKEIPSNFYFAGDYFDRITKFCQLLHIEISDNMDSLLYPVNMNYIDWFFSMLNQP